MDTLKLFYDNKPQLEAVKAFLNQVLKDLAVKKLFAGEDAVPVAKAQEVVDTAFSKLKELYEPRKTTRAYNKAR